MPNEPMANLRDSVARLRKEGERVAARIEKDVRDLAKRTRAEIETDIRKLQTTVRERADEAIRDVEKRGARFLAAVEKQVAPTVKEVLKRLQAATQTDVAAVVKRVHALEARVAELEGRKSTNVPTLGIRGDGRHEPSRPEPSPSPSPRGERGVT